MIGVIQPKSNSKNQMKKSNKSKKEQKTKEYMEFTVDEPQVFKELVENLRNS